MQPFLYEGLVFRAFDDSDAENFAAAARESVDSAGQWMSWCNPAFARQDALDWFQLCRVAVAAGSTHEFGVFSAATGEFLGGAGLNAINREHLFCNLGYWVRQSAQRQGVALRSVRALARYAFNTLGMQRVEIVIASGNIPSAGVAHKSGAQFECVAQNRLQLHGVAVSASVFSIPPWQVAFTG